MQTKEAFLEFETQLTNNLQAHPDVLGLTFVGSAADHSRIDEWSDHDFFLVTIEGKGEGLRQDLTWLPNHEQIAFHPRETAHGLKVVYQDGHVLEFAVFNDSELELASANSFLVTVDKSGNIQNRMSAIAERSATKVKETEYNPEAAYELLLCQLLIGVGRARRGENLIASEHIRSWAVTALVGLIRFWEDPQQRTIHLSDNLNSLRRFEQQYPEFGLAIEKAQTLPTEACAKALLKILLDSRHLSQRQQEQAQVVIKRLMWQV